MADNFSILLMPKVLFRPTEVFSRLTENPPSALAVFFGFALWLGILPPIFAYIGAMNFGWRLGVVEPLFFPWHITLGISAAYFGALLFGFLSAAFIARWMASTYGADVSRGAHFALIAVVGAPLTVGSVMHLYPHVFLNVVVLVPALVWSMYLLYTGLPVVLKTGPERGMLMASAIIGYLLVASVTLLGITVMLWSYGIGPRMGI